MKLSIIYQNKRREEIGVLRVFIMEVPGKGQCLYFETASDQRGKGKIVPLSEVKCWEVNAVVVGGSANLVL